MKQIDVPVEDLVSSPKNTTTELADQLYPIRLHVDYGTDRTSTVERRYSYCTLRSSRSTLYVKMRERKERRTRLVTHSLLEVGKVGLNID
jgi:hypothetical protein